MKHIFAWILDHKKTVLTFFIVSTIACVIMWQFVNVNYELMDYLPDEAMSTLSLNTMEDEYDGGIPNARIMIPVQGVADALRFKDEMLAIDGVDDVMWLDDSVDVYEPLSTFDQKTVEDYYKDGFALYTVTLNEEKQIDAYYALQALVGDDGAMTGNAINTVASTVSCGPEIKTATIIIIAILFVILLLTTDSWFEPILFLVTIGVAVVLNSGTNLMFGTISFVTNAAGSILQLGCSMDYAIFLLHRFSEYRNEGHDVKEAMQMALEKSVGSISSSAFTTIIGFAALILMRFKIGPDMGIVMAKAIALSMITVLVLLPVLALYCYKLIDKLQHKSLMPKFKGFAKVVRGVRLPALLVFLALLVPCYMAQNSNTFYFGSSHIFDDPAIRVCADREKVESTFGKSNLMVLMVPKGDFAREQKLSDELHEIPQVSSILSYVDTVGSVIPTSYLEDSTLSKLISEHYSRLVLTVDTDYEGTEAFAIVDQIRALAEGYYPDEYYLAGESVNTKDLRDVVTDDMTRVNLIAIGAVFLTLLVSFKSLTLPVVLVLAIELAIWVNMAIPYFTNSTVFYMAYLILSSVQLGATVDYAILLTSRYLEEREKANKRDAILKASQATALSILTSGLIMITGCQVLGMLCTHGIISQIGTMLARGTILSVVMVLFVLPALLYYMDGAIRRTTFGLNLAANLKKRVEQKKDSRSVQS